MDIVHTKQEEKEKFEETKANEPTEDEKTLWMEADGGTRGGKWKVTQFHPSQ